MMKRQDGEEKQKQGTDRERKATTENVIIANERKYINTAKRERERDGERLIKDNEGGQMIQERKQIEKKQKRNKGKRRTEGRQRRGEERRRGREAREDKY